MIAGADLARNLQGAFRLAGRDPSGLDWFGTDLGAFWRSFFAAVIAIPFYVAIVAGSPVDRPITVTDGAYTLTQTIAYVCGWFAFPLVMVYVTQLIDRQAQYVRYIVAANWCSTIPLCIFGVLALLGASGTLPQGIVDTIYFIVLLWTLAFHWFVARVGLEINGLGAAGIVALDMMIGLLISGAADAITTQTF